MEKQLTIWEWIEMQKEQRENGVRSRIITVENTTENESIKLNGMCTFAYIGGFAVVVDEIKIEVEENDFGKLISVLFKNEGKIAMLVRVNYDEFVRIEQLSISQSIVLEKGTL